MKIVTTRVFEAGDPEPPSDVTRVEGRRGDIITRSPDGWSVWWMERARPWRCWLAEEGPLREIKR